MAPKSSQSSQNNTQKSKQQTISSFFTPKPSQLSKAPSKLAAPTPPTASNDVNDSSNDDDALPLRPLTPARKRSIDEHGEDHDTGRSSPPKRVRCANGEARPSLGQASATSLNASNPPKITERTSKFLFSSSS